MAKVKKKLTTAQKRAKKEFKANYKMVFMNGKQVKVKKTPTIDGLTVEEFLRRNANPIGLHQNEMWEYIDIEDDEIPF
ncbi:MAG: hypothetical protein GQ569_03450 [Methylococcaceae bacterium]|nr:hypothetical protein [Methylococcaceae bacterium]